MAWCGLTLRIQALNNLTNMARETVMPHLGFKRNRSAVDLRTQRAVVAADYPGRYGAHGIRHIIPS